MKLVSYTTAIIVLLVAVALIGLWLSRPAASVNTCLQNGHSQIECAVLENE